MTLKRAEFRSKEEAAEGQAVGVVEGQKCAHLTLVIAIGL